MKIAQLKEAIVEVLQNCLLSTDSKIVNMIAGTACVESNCGEYIKQVKGPACGIFQIEPKTARDIYTNYIQYHSNYKHYYDKYYNNYLTLEQNLKFNLAFSIFMCRMFYMRIKAPIPDTVQEQAQYWKKYYNTELGKGTVDNYIKKGKRYGLF